jgi:hypothetical protein
MKPKSEVPWIRAGIVERENTGSVAIQNPGDADMGVMMLKMVRIARKKGFMQALDTRERIIAVMKARDEFHSAATEIVVRQELSRLCIMPDKPKP